MIIYLINDKDKKFRFNGKIYKTPCRIYLNGNNEINQLIFVLKENKIKNVKIKNVTNKKYNSIIKKQPINACESKLVLSTKLK